MKRVCSILLSLALMLAAVPAVLAAPAADAPLMDGATLVTFGDSLTALSTWPQSVAKALNMKLVNSGIGGNTTAHAAARFERDVAAHDPDFVIMCFGTNDFNRSVNADKSPRVDVATYKTNLQNFIADVRALGAEPILMTPPFISPGAAGGASIYPEGSVNYALDVYVDAMRETASTYNVPLIDMHYECDTGGYTTASFLISDGVHLSTHGNQVYTNTITAFMKEHYREDPSAPRVEYPTAPKAEPGVWTKPIATTNLDDWLIIYPDDAYGIQEADGSLSFANKNGQWPEVHYSPAITDAVTAPVKGSYLTVDMELQAGTNIILFFNGPNPTLAYGNTYFSLTSALKKAIPTLQTSYDDILGNQSIYATLPLEDIIPSSFIAADGTVVFSGVKVFAVGAAHKKVTIKELSVTTTDDSVVPETPVCEDVQSLLPTEASQVAAESGIADYVVGNGFFTLSRAGVSAIAWPSVRVTCGKTIDLTKTPYLHLKVGTAGGAANGYLYYTNAYGTSGSVQLSQLVNGNEYDFTTDTDVYVDLAKALGITGTITLNSYTLSVYGMDDDAVTWTALATAKEISDTDRPLGDVNSDGTLDTSDVKTVLRHILTDTAMEDDTFAFADYNGDGRVATDDLRAMLLTITL
ncbi:MAG: hypothetical protein IJC52_03105 [Clostridia bacterium]|nr:hypothetical protein [Clostridia bacterium]